MRAPGVRQARSDRIRLATGKHDVLRRAPDTSRTQPEAANKGPPRVSVVIPVYNAGSLLRPCIDSVLGQDLHPRAFEVIAVDDGSTDGSGGVLDDYAATHPNIQVIH